MNRRYHLSIPCIYLPCQNVVAPLPTMQPISSISIGAWGGVIREVSDVVHLSGTLTSLHSTTADLFYFKTWIVLSGITWVTKVFARLFFHICKSNHKKLSKTKERRKKCRFLPAVKITHDLFGKHVTLTPWIICDSHFCVWVTLTPKRTLTCLMSYCLSCKWRSHYILIKILKIRI